MNTREIVLDMLIEVLEKGRHSHVVMNRILSEHDDLDKKDRSFMKRLLNGTLERVINLDYDIERFSKIKVNKMKPLIRNILRMSMYQIKYMDQIPDSAVCNEAVKLAKKRGFQSLSGFVNGILRNAVRNRDLLFHYPDSLGIATRLSIVYSTPLWIVDKLLEQYNKETVENILSSSLEEKEVTIRVNESKKSVEEVKEILKEEGVTVLNGSYCKQALKIKDFDLLERLDSFQRGYYQVQDESSMLVGMIAGVSAGDIIMDVCSAPGGKALHMSELLNVAENYDKTNTKSKKGMVIARDLTEKKVALIEENIARIKPNNMKTGVWDARTFDEHSKSTADIVIADLPCSGLGVIGKKPDIKYNLKEEQQKELVKLQREILEVVVRYVKKGGTLIYSTCTINRDENEGNLEFLLKHFPLQTESLEDYLPKSLWSETTKKGYLQLLPGIHETDGFFIARLKRVE